MDGTDLSTVAKSNNGKLCATGDDFGKIKLYSHPVTQPKVNTKYLPGSFLQAKNTIGKIYLVYVVNTFFMIMKKDILYLNFLYIHMCTYFFLKIGTWMVS